MKQFNWIKVLVGMLVALALLAPSGAAFAAEQTGIGTITAKGVGYARIEGSGTVVVEHGAGNLGDGRKRYSNYWAWPQNHLSQWNHPPHWV